MHLWKKPKIIYVACLAHCLAQNKPSGRVSYCSCHCCNDNCSNDSCSSHAAANQVTNEDSPKYENIPESLCFRFLQCIVLLISLLRVTSFLPARQKGPDKCTKTYNTMSNMIRMVKTTYYGHSK